METVAAPVSRWERLASRAQRQSGTAAWSDAILRELLEPAHAVTARRPVG